MKKTTDFWFVLLLFSLFYFWGLGFVSFLGLVVFIFWILRKKPISWWAIVFFCSANILAFRTPIFFLVFGLFFYFYLGFTGGFLSGSSGMSQDDKGTVLHDVRHPADFAGMRSFQAFLLFVSAFDLFFLASNYRFTLGVSWLLFLGLIFYLSRFYFKDYSKITRLIFSFVFSQLFFILYFLPFGNFTNAGVAAIFFIALSNYKKNRSLKQLFFLAFLCLSLLWLSGIRPQ